MATYHLQCDRCDWSATTVGPSSAARGGTVARLYCPTCGTVRDCALASPSRGPLGVPLGPRHGQASRLARGLARRLVGEAALLAAARCPTCHQSGLLLAPSVGQKVPCPRCGGGQLGADRVAD